MYSFVYVDGLGFLVICTGFVSTLIGVVDRSSVSSKFYALSACKIMGRKQELVC